MSRASPPPPAAIEAVLAAYGRRGARVSPLAGGLINLGFLIESATGERGVLQRLHPVFDAAVNDNIEAVTAQLAARGHATPRLLRTLDGRRAVEHEGAVWRLLSFVPGVTHHSVPDLGVAREAGRLLGRFHGAFAAAPIVLPHLRPPVHELARHLAALRAALDDHPDHPLRPAIGSLAGSLLAHAAQLPPLPAAPRRLVHGDPKLSNLMFTPEGAGLCLIDLDTVTMAPLAPELGDAFRSWCNPGGEDGERGRFSLPIFEAALAGYAAEAAGFMTPEEAASVVAATETIYLELAARFAADALHERYFGWDSARFGSAGEHNRARAANQLAAARSLAAQRTAAEAIAGRAFADARSS